jgi:hypothetical protein
MTRRALTLGCLAALLAASPAAGAAPNVEQLVVFRDGHAVARTVAAKELRVRVGGRRCTAGEGTALAALARSKVGRLGLRDFGSCSSRARDSAGLFVQSIAGERNRGQNGWVYKVGRRAATAGAADPSGPFGRGRLKRGQRVTWFYCRLEEGGCQRTLALSASAEPGAVDVTVRGYDDEGRGVPVDGATVRAGEVTALTAADGSARLALPAGGHRLVAEKDGLIRSFAERVAVP